MKGTRLASLNNISGIVRTVRNLIFKYFCIFENVLRYSLGKNPILSYLELHLTDHCNLNCKGCTHFSCLADEYYLDPSQHYKDMQRLSELFKNIKFIRLMGGEPLLHQNVSDFFEITRKTFPLSKILLVTNGILLPAMPEGFWESCKKNNIVIEVTRYPIKFPYDKIKKIGLEKGVRIVISEVVARFFAFLNVQGDSDPKKSMRNCRQDFYCPFLREGKIYPCSFSAMANYFNQKFATNIPSDGYLDIHSLKIKAFKILDFLNKPSRACSFCATEHRLFNWGVTGQNLNEWTVNS